MPTSLLRRTLVCLALAQSLINLAEAVRFDTEEQQRACNTTTLRAHLKSLCPSWKPKYLPRALAFLSEVHVARKAGGPPSLILNSFYGTTDQHLAHGAELLSDALQHPLVFTIRHDADRRQFVEKVALLADLAAGSSRLRMDGCNEEHGTGMVSERELREALYLMFAMYNAQKENLITNAVMPAIDKFAEITQLDADAAGADDEHEIRSRSFYAQSLRRLCEEEVQARRAKEGFWQRRLPQRLKEMASENLPDWAPADALRRIGAGWRLLDSETLSHKQISLEEKFNCSRGQGAAFLSYRDTGHRTFQGCAQLCDEDDRCEGFDYTENTSTHLEIFSWNPQVHKEDSCRLYGVNEPRLWPFHKALGAGKDRQYCAKDQAKLCEWDTLSRLAVEQVNTQLVEQLALDLQRPLKDTGCRPDDLRGLDASHDTFLHLISASLGGN